MSAANETETVYQVQTLAEWCTAHNEPYTLVDPGGEIVRRYVVGKEGQTVDFFSPPVFFGRVPDSVILPVSTFSYTADHAIIYEGLTHRDYALSTLRAARDAGASVLIVEQRMAECLEIADRAYILHDGQVLMEGTPAEIVSDANVRRVYLGERFSL